MINTRSDLTFKHNLKQGRHGWLRLTPAYSIKVVEQILEKNPGTTYVLDPFSGTGTTGLVCAEHNINCDLIDINPFLVWFGGVKTANYSQDDLRQTQQGATSICKKVIENHKVDNLWFPPISDITRWWAKNRLILLAKIYAELEHQFPENSPAKDLLLVAFCHLLINWSNAAFNHQSMSFKTHYHQQLGLFDNTEQDLILQHFTEIVQRITASAEKYVSGRVKVIQGDSRYVPPSVNRLYDCVITSPPYPNRMSYIRELRPYMYWLGYLNEAREAGELDWQAIGGTWGIATSRIQKWQPEEDHIHYLGFESIIQQIARQSFLLANYVHKYFIDISIHLNGLYDAVAPGASVFYIVGNSKFYETLVPVEQIYAQLLSQSGFVDIKIETLRKRNSKKELLEFVISAKKRN
jgi:hypothetical protein